MSDCCSAKPKGHWFSEHKLLFLAGGVLLVLLAASFFPVLEPFRNVFLMYARMVFWPLVLGLFLGGAIDLYVPGEYVSHILAGRRKRSIVFAVAWGFLMTLCSHGILALAVQLYKKGAAPSSVVAFLLASPWANFPLTLMLVGFFGWAKALFIVFSAIIIALITGRTFQVLESRGMIDSNPNTLTVEEDFDLLADIRTRWAGYRCDPVRELQGIVKGVRELSSMVLWWILLGMTLSSVAGAYIPADLFHRFMGNSIGGMFGTLAAATVIETCSEGSSPLAFEIYRQTGALGNALIFLLAGVATDYTEISLLWANAGRRTALWMPAVCVPLILLFGAIGNTIFR